MPEIDVSEDQLAYLEELQSALAADVPYGHVRVRDALQYLIDHHEGDAEELRDVADNADADVDRSEPTSVVEDLSGSASGGASATPSPDLSSPDEVERPDESGAETSATSETSSGDLPSGPGSSGGDRVQEMMNLLETYDDQWQESDAQDARYEVTLPNGDVEYARTRDDVRSLLFKHHR